MNSITPAYSVIAIILILLGYTLTGYPVSVFAQEESLDQSATSSAIDEDVLDDDGQLSPSATDAVNHPYKIDQLNSERVYSDFVVGPGRFNLQIAPGESQTVEMIVTNRMGMPRTFSLVAEDMAGSDNPEETIVLLGDDVGPYSLKDFISVPQNTFVLNHSERAHIPVTITLPADVEPGGFYGSLLTQIISDDTPGPDGDIKAATKIVSRIGTLFFITTPGEQQYESRLADFSTLGNKKFYSKGPITFNAVVENTGSVHVRPYGEIRILNMLGNEVGYVQLQPWYALPQSVRNKEVRWDREFLVGRYTAIAEINRGYDDIVDTVKYTFWVIPLELLIGTFVILFLIFLLFRFFFSRFELRVKDR